MLRITKSLTCLFIALAAVATVFAQSAARSDAALWKEDLDFFARSAPHTHAALYHKMSEPEFSAAVQKLRAKLPSLERHQFLVELARIVTRIGDGHSYLDLAGEEVGFGQLPVRFYLFDDGLYIIAAQKEFSRLVGARVVAFGGTPWKAAYDAVSEVTSHDNDMQLRSLVPAYLSIPEVLHALHISNELGKVALLLERDGAERLEILPPMADAPKGFRPGWILPPDWIDAHTSGAPVPLWLKDPGNIFWYEYLPVTRTLYVQYNAVYPKSNESIAAFFRRVMQFAESNPVDEYVLDMRLNTGGNNQFNLPIIHGFVRSDKINQKGKLFTVIGRQTFSAAQNCVNLLEKHTQTLFAGEPTGARPNHYGDPTTLLLPNTKIPVRLSTLWWQDAGPRDQREWRAPDLAVDLRFADYQAGRDPVLQTILDFVSNPGLAEKVRAAVLAKDIPAAQAAIAQFQKDPVHRYRSAESEVNELGYSLLRGGQKDAALEVFKLNVAAFPNSSNAYDSLAEGYLVSGNRDEAIRNYAKSLELNPQNGNARIMLRRLRPQ